MKTVKIVNFSANLFTTILSLILGVVIFWHPELVTIVISYFLGTVLMCYGIGKIIYFSYQKGKDANTNFIPCIIGIILILIGLACMFFSGIIEQIIRFIIGAFILIIGINRLIKIFSISDKKSSQFIAGLIVAFLLVIIGLYVIFVSNLLIQYLGLVLIVYSAIEIINYIIMASNGEYKNITIHEATVQEKDEKTTLEIPDNSNKKDKKNKKNKKSKN